MAEYIDKGKTVKVLREVADQSVGLYAVIVRSAANAIEKIPAADVRPVVKATWQYKTMTVPGGKGQTYAKWCCTACKGKAKERTNFCPNCGADMREES